MWLMEAGAAKHHSSLQSSSSQEELISLVALLDNTRQAQASLIMVRQLYAADELVC